MNFCPKFEIKIPRETRINVVRAGFLALAAVFVLLLCTLSGKPAPADVIKESPGSEGSQDMPGEMLTPEPERPAAQPAPDLTVVPPTPEPPTPEPPTPEPPTPEPPPEQEPVPATPQQPQSLFEAVSETNDWVRITMHWPYWEGTAPTVFERDKNSPVWTQASRDGYTRIVDADFTQSGGTVYIGIPTTESKFILEEDGTGSLFSERLTWTYETDAAFSLGSSCGIDLTYDLKEVMDSDALVVIRVYWSNGEFAYFYRNNKGGWQMRGRQSGIRTISPAFGYPSNSVEMSFKVSSSKHSFSFADGGTGSAEGESITWNYSYFDN